VVIANAEQSKWIAVGQPTDQVNNGYYFVLDAIVSSATILNRVSAEKDAR